MVSDPAEHDIPSKDLAEELLARSFGDGANVGLWPGMTIYRYVEPTVPKWDEIQSLSVCIVAQGRKAVTADGHHYVYDRFQYLVLRSNLHFQSQILDATPDKPFLAFVLQIDPVVVRRVSAPMDGRRNSRNHPPAPTGSQDQSVVSELDDELMGAVLRFLRSLTAESDRRVLAPLYLHELVYRILQRDRFSKLLLIAGQQEDGNPIAAALNYINAHLSEPLTVDILAGQVNLSSSAFSRRFRELTGNSPYQFVKETRLEAGARTATRTPTAGHGRIRCGRIREPVALHDGIPGALRDHTARVRRRRWTEPRSACHSLTPVYRRRGKFRLASKSYSRRNHLRDRNLGDLP